MTLNPRQAGKRGLPRHITDPNIQQNFQYLAQQLQLARDEVGQGVIGPPYVEFVKQSVGAEEDTFDLSIRVVVPGRRKGYVYAWLNGDSADDADSAVDPDGFFRIFGTTTIPSDSEWTLGAGLFVRADDEDDEPGELPADPTTDTLLNEVTVSPRGKRIFLAIILDDGTHSGIRDFWLTPSDEIVPAPRTRSSRSARSTSRRWTALSRSRRRRGHARLRSSSRRTLRPATWGPRSARSSRSLSTTSRASRSTSTPPPGS